MKLQRSDFVKAPAMHLLEAEDREEVIELTRYYERTHAIIPMTLKEGGATFSNGSSKRKYYLYNDEHPGRHMEDSPPDTVIGVIVTVTPYTYAQFNEEQGRELAIAEAGFAARDKARKEAGDVEPEVVVG